MQECEITKLKLLFNKDSTDPKNYWPISTLSPCVQSYREINPLSITTHS